MAEAQRIIGACVRHFREQQRRTQESLAAQAGISYQYLSGIEKGKENLSIQVLEQLSAALGLPLRILVTTAYDNDAGHLPPLVSVEHFRKDVPLPPGMTYEQLRTALDLTQSIVHRLNRNMIAEIGKTLQSLIQGNNFSGLVSNVLTDSFDQCSTYKHNHDQKYPDLVMSGVGGGKSEGLEVKTTMNVGKGGESHNGHSGWHVIACYNFLPNGDIRFVHVMFAVLTSHLHPKAPDWKYTGSSVNAATGSRRTETFSTNAFGTTKLRDASAYLDPSVVDFSRWRPKRIGAVPSFSIWAT
jgi:DNA-binding XRE family transcriptional regulator